MDLFFATAKQPVSQVLNDIGPFAHSLGSAYGTRHLWGARAIKTRRPSDTLRHETARYVVTQAHF